MIVRHTTPTLADLPASVSVARTRLAVLRIFRRVQRHA